MATYGTYNTPGGFKLTFYGVLLIAAFLIMFYLVRDMYREHNPGPINAARAAERAKVRREITEKAHAELDTAGWVDKAKGIVRLPIARAMELTVKGYQNPNPETAHSNLVARVQKATAPAPQQSFE